jgi:carbon storage regulator
MEMVKHEHGGLTMLVLTRKSRESVVVGGSHRFPRILKVTVLEVRGEKVKLGLEVDADVPVHRLEVWERVFGARALDGQTDDVSVRAEKTSAAKSR